MGCYDERNELIIMILYLCLDLISLFAIFDKQYIIKDIMKCFDYIFCCI